MFSGFGGLEEAYWPLVRGFKPGRSCRIYGRKNPQHAFLRRGSKAVSPMSCFTACKRLKKWRGSRHFRQNSLGHFFPIVPPSAVRFASIASDAGGLLWRNLELSKSLVLPLGGGWTCRWQRHSVKPSCWECSTTVEQAETQLRFVVPIEEEEEYYMNVYVMVVNALYVPEHCSTLVWGWLLYSRNMSPYN
jgi:hypothetical protein